ATYGCIVYQEQVMQIVRDLSGYSWGRSDLVRRAMSKKKESVMLKERHNFVYGNPDEGVPGCVSRGIDPAIADKIFDEMVDFAKYAFNKSHAACYAVVAYQTAWLKYYYPKEFMASLMSSVNDVTVKVTDYIRVCRRMGIRILPPDVNEGGSEFSVSADGIRYGLSAIKSVGRSVIDSIIREREASGRFRDLADFVKRMAGGDVNRRTIENLIKAGALDCLPGTRKQKMLGYAGLLDRFTREKKDGISGQMNLFDLLAPEDKEELPDSLPPVGEYRKEDYLAFEKEVLGLYVTGHPLDDVESRWRQNVTATAIDFYVDEESGKAAVSDGSRATVGGLVTAVTVKSTRSGESMAFVTIEDLTGTVEILFFPKLFARVRAQLTIDAKLFVWGRVTVGDETQGKLIADDILPIDPWPIEVWIRFPDRYVFENCRDELMSIAGDKGFTVFLAQERQRLQRRGTDPVNMDEATVLRLGQCFGTDNFKITEKKLEDIIRRR
ncbi:MAG: DNA polymerase III subunit alpha, partial [Lachnospiraceae bacterium]|nr:DNA polymerase III subunit alpha [Lachnospiraceae bacterium]